MADWIKATAPILLVVTVGAGAVAIALAGSGLFTAQTEEAEEIATAAPEQQISPAIPALDTVAPAHVETATFALG
jgi:hypothetical protein